MTGRTERREPTERQIAAMAACVLEVYGYDDPRDARRAVVSTHVHLADEHQTPYWVWSGAR